MEMFKNNNKIICIKKGIYTEPNKVYEVIDYIPKENRLWVMCDDGMVRYTSNPEIFFIDIKLYRDKTINQILE